MIGKFIPDASKRDENRPVAAFAGARSQGRIYIHDLSRGPICYGGNYLFVKQVRGRFVLIGTADDESMAQVAARDHGYAPANRSNGISDDTSECQMFVDAPIREAEHDDRPVPSGLMQIVERDHRSVIQRIFPRQLSKWNELRFGRSGNRTDEVEIVVKREAHAGRPELAEVTLEVGRCARRKRIGIEGRVRRDKNYRVRPRVNKALREVDQ
jgi:hypothetical protein